MKILVLLLGAVLSFSGCAIHINPDGWQYLSSEEKVRFRAFNESSTPSEEVIYRQITADDILKNASNQSYSWVMIAQNCCIAYPQTLKSLWLPFRDSLSRKGNVKSYVVFDTYQLRFLDIFEKKCQPKEGSYILLNSRYGNNYRKKIRRFLHEIAPEYKFKNTGTVHLLIDSTGKCVYADEEIFFGADTLSKRNDIIRSLKTLMKP